MQRDAGLASILLGLYAAQSVTGSIVQTALPVVLRDAGVALDQIGFLSLLFLPWVFKVLWAPLVDRFGSPRLWILACQGLLSLCFLIAARFSPVDSLSAVTPILFVMAVIAATQDIATDAAGIHATEPDDRVLASGASTVGGYLGFLLGGGVWLWVYAHSGWAPSMLVLAFAMVLFAAPVMRLRLPDIPKQGEKASLRRSFGNRALLAGIGFLILWQSGIRLGSAMAGPMLVDAGLDLEEIAWLRGAGGMVVGLSAAVLGTLAVRRFGKRSVLILAGCAMIVALAGLIWWSLHPGSLPLLALLQIALMSSTAVSFVALYAAMMDWCTPRQAATDFALLQSLDAAIAVVTGILAGQMAEAWGYAPVFALAGAFLLVALPLTRARLERRADDTPHSPFPATESPT
jgi:MFS transporter (putative signal transducer)